MYIIINNNKIPLEDANSFIKKLKGFMFTKNINHCKRFKCSSIHTFFMLDNIDIIQTDINNKIVRYYKNFKKNRIILPKKNIYYTYEMPKDVINNINIGETLIVNN